MTRIRSPRLLTASVGRQKRITSFARERHVSMKKATTIFGSKSERRAFEAIDRHLPSGWRLYGNTPLSKIVEIRKDELTEKKWDYYLKASVDSVLTNPTHAPALAIDFNGLGEGYSSGKRYILERQVEKDPYRELKTIDSA